MAFKDFKLHFKLEYDIKTNAYNMEKILELINRNIFKEFKENIKDFTNVEVMPTLTRIDLGGNDGENNENLQNESRNIK